MTPTGDVVLDRGKRQNEDEQNKEQKHDDVAVDAEVEAAAKTKQDKALLPRRQGGREMARDVMSKHKGLIHAVL